MNQIEPPELEPSEAASEQAPDVAVGLDAIIGLLLRQWKLIVFVPVLVLLGTYGGLKLLTPSYKSTVEILVADPRLRDEVGGGQLSPLDFDSAAISNEMALISSRPLVLRVARELGLDKDEAVQWGGLTATVVEKLGLSHYDWAEALLHRQPAETAAEDQAEALDRAVFLLERRIAVERLGVSYVIAITVTWDDPKMAQRLANTFAEDYLADETQMRADALQHTAAWMTGRLEELHNRVLANQEARRKLAAQTGLNDAGPGGSFNQQQAAEIEAQLVAARADLAGKRAEYDQLRHVLETGGDAGEVPEVMSSGVISQLRLEEAELSRKEAALRSQFGEQYPEVIAVHSQREDARRAIDGEIRRILGNLKNAVDGAAQREQSLVASLQKVSATAARSPGGAQLNSLEADGDVDQKAYETLLAQYNELTSRRAHPETGARISVPASFPPAPTFPRPLLIYPLAAAGGIAGGIMLALLAELADSGFKTATKVEEAFGYYVVGMIPLTRPRPSRRAHSGNAIVREMAAAPLSRLSEAMRAIRIGLGLAHVGAKTRVVLVTSALPNEGKSTTALLLAASSAIAGRKTILVDCDLRHKSVSKAYGDNLEGLTDVLLGRVQISAVTLTDEATGTFVVPAGSSVRNPIDLLTSQRMWELLAQLRVEYECVVLDTAPLLAAADAVSLAPLAGKILLVIEWGRTPRKAVVEALKSLRSEAHHIAGIVLAKVDFKRLRRYGYGYGHGYSYGRYYRAVDHYYSQ